MNIATYMMAALAMLFCYSCAHDDHDGQDHGHDHAHHAVEGHDHDDHDEDEHEHEHVHEHEADSHGEKHSDDEISLSAEKAAKLGVKADTVRLQPISEVVKVTGEVIADPSDRAVVVAPMAGRVTFAGNVREGMSVGRGQRIASISGAEFSGGDANKRAQIQVEAAKRELDRLRPLLAEGLATNAEYNEAERAYLDALSAVGTSGGSATAPIAGVITAVDVANGQYVEAGTPIAQISANGRLTVRADVPKRYSSAARTARSATVRVPYSDTAINATLSAKQSDASATTAYLPVYFTIPSTSALTPGSFVEMYLNVGQDRPGIKVPLASVTERLGQKFVYVKIDDDCYERRPVTVGTTDGSTIEIVSGLASGDVVVTEGTTFVRLAETSNVAPPGHTHNH